MVYWLSMVFFNGVFNDFCRCSIVFIGFPVVALLFSLAFSLMLIVCTGVSMVFIGSIDFSLVFPWFSCSCSSCLLVTKIHCCLYALAFAVLVD